jgi:pilus assembly protein Flp/PilA
MAFRRQRLPLRGRTGGDRVEGADKPMVTSFQFLAHWLRARFAANDRGATVIEYVFLVALIAVICITAMTLLGRSASTRFSSFGNSVSN